jgi:two-component system OmpR family response regulator/two-component system alkaline phosphatase synthesis response regulator PhoP
LSLKVLLVENESIVPHSLKSDLLDSGYAVTTVHAPVEVFSASTYEWPDVVVINDCDGSLDVEAIYQALDETSLQLPCLIVTRDTTARRAFAAAYLPVPFNSHQFTQSLKKAIGRQNDRFLRVGDTVLDGLKRRMQREGRITHLTPKEFKLLHLLMENAGEVLSRGRIMKDVWETEYLGDTRTLDVHIRWVREKLEDNPSRPRHIVTVRGVGYRFASGKGGHG